MVTNKEMTMRLAVNERLCSGQGRCYVVSPDLFTSDDEGFCAERGTAVEVPAGLEDNARLAVDSCPEGAIEIVDDSSKGETDD
jgi:ferredoxin